MSSLPPDQVEPTGRAALTRRRIVAAAVELVDESGPEALTMRAVAQRLGAGTMSLYRHVRGREELLDLVLEELTAEVPASPPTGDWRADLATIARAMRAALVRRPRLTALLAERAGSGRAELAMLDRTLGVLRAAGFGRRGAVMADHALGNYVAGVALWETSGPGGSRDEAHEAPEEGQFANLDWVGAKLGAPTLDERFEFGLACLLDGFEAYLARRAR